jgi:hypothetical protein
MIANQSSALNSGVPSRLLTASGNSGGDEDKGPVVHEGKDATAEVGAERRTFLSALAVAAGFCFDSGDMIGSALAYATLGPIGYPSQMSSLLALASCKTGPLAPETRQLSAWAAARASALARRCLKITQELMPSFASQERDEDEEKIAFLATVPHRLACYVMGRALVDMAVGASDIMLFSGLPGCTMPGAASDAAPFWQNPFSADRPSPLPVHIAVASAFEPLLLDLVDGEGILPLSVIQSELQGDAAASSSVGDAGADVSGTRAADLRTHEVHTQVDRSRQISPENGVANVSFIPGFSSPLPSSRGGFASASASTSNIAGMHTSFISSQFRSPAAFGDNGLGARARSLATDQCARHMARTIDLLFTPARSLARSARPPSTSAAKSVSDAMNLTSTGAANSAAVLACPARLPIVIPISLSALNDTTLSATGMEATTHTRQVDTSSGSTSFFAIDPSAPLVAVATEPAAPLAFLHRSISGSLAGLLFGSVNLSHVCAFVLDLLSVAACGSPVSTMGGMRTAPSQLSSECLQRMMVLLCGSTYHFLSASTVEDKLRSDRAHQMKSILALFSSNLQGTTRLTMLSSRGSIESILAFSMAQVSRGLRLALTISESEGSKGSIERDAALRRQLQELIATTLAVLRKDQIDRILQDALAELGTAVQSTGEAMIKQAPFGRYLHSETVDVLAVSTVEVPTDSRKPRQSQPQRYVRETPNQWVAPQAKVELALIAAEEGHPLSADTALLAALQRLPPRKDAQNLLEVLASVSPLSAQSLLKKGVTLCQSDAIDVSPEDTTAESSLSLIRSFYEYSILHDLVLAVPSSNGDVRRSARRAMHQLDLLTEAILRRCTGATEAGNSSNVNANKHDALTESGVLAKKFARAAANFLDAAAFILQETSRSTETPVSAVWASLASMVSLDTPSVTATEKNAYPATLSSIVTNLRMMLANLWHLQNRNTASAVIMGVAPTYPLSAYRKNAATASAAGSLLQSVLLEVQVLMNAIAGTPDPLTGNIAPKPMLEACLSKALPCARTLVKLAHPTAVVAALPLLATTEKFEMLLPMYIRLLSRELRQAVSSRLQEETKNALNSAAANCPHALPLRRLKDLGFAWFDESISYKERLDWACSMGSPEDILDAAGDALVYLSTTLMTRETADEISADIVGSPSAVVAAVLAAGFPSFTASFLVGVSAGLFVVDDSDAANQKTLLAAMPALDASESAAMPVQFAAYPQAVSKERRQSFIASISRRNSVLSVADTASILSADFGAEKSMEEAQPEKMVRKTRHDLVLPLTDTVVVPPTVTRMLIPKAGHGKPEVQESPKITPVATIIPSVPAFHMTKPLVPLEPPSAEPSFDSGSRRDSEASIALGSIEAAIAEEIQRMAARGQVTNRTSISELGAATEKKTSRSNSPVPLIVAIPEKPLQENTTKVEVMSTETTKAMGIVSGNVSRRNSASTGALQTATGVGPMQISVSLAGLRKAAPKMPPRLLSATAEPEPAEPMQTNESHSREASSPNLSNVGASTTTIHDKSSSSAATHSVISPNATIAAAADECSAVGSSGTSVLHVSSATQAGVSVDQTSISGSASASATMLEVSASVDVSVANPSGAVPDALNTSYGFLASAREKVQRQKQQQQASVLPTLRFPMGEALYADDLTMLKQLASDLTAVPLGDTFADNLETTRLQQQAAAQPVFRSPTQTKLGISFNFLPPKRTALNQVPQAAQNTMPAAQKTPTKAPNNSISSNQVHLQNADQFATYPVAAQVLQHMTPLDRAAARSAFLGQLIDGASSTADRLESEYSAMGAGIESVVLDELMKERSRKLQSLRERVDTVLAESTGETTVPIILSEAAQERKPAAVTKRSVRDFKLEF